MTSVSSWKAERIGHHPCRSALAVPKPHGQDCARAQTPNAVLDVDPRGDQEPSDIRGGQRSVPPVPVGSQQCSLPQGIEVLESWGFRYKSNLVWHKIRKDGGSDGRGVGFYFRNVTELVLFGIRGKNARTLKPGRTQVNYLSSRKREHSRKPDEQYAIVEACSPGLTSSCLPEARENGG